VKKNTWDTLEFYRNQFLEIAGNALECSVKNRNRWRQTGRQLFRELFRGCYRPGFCRHQGFWVYDLLCQPALLFLFIKPHRDDPVWKQENAGTFWRYKWFLGVGFTKPTARSMALLHGAIENFEGRPGGTILPFHVQLAKKACQQLNRENPFICSSSSLHTAAEEWLKIVGFGDSEEDQEEQKQ
jgi:hypothetical protein